MSTSCLSIQSTQSRVDDGVDGAAVFSAADFNPDAFDPRHWAIEYSSDPTLPTNFMVGDKGAIQFHSAERCQGLYTRHLTRTAKGQR